MENGLFSGFLSGAPHAPPHAAAASAAAAEHLSSLAAAAAAAGRGGWPHVPPPHHGGVTPAGFPGFPPHPAPSPAPPLAHHGHGAQPPPQPPHPPRPVPPHHPHHHLLHGAAGGLFSPAAAASGTSHPAPPPAHKESKPKTEVLRRDEGASRSYISPSRETLFSHGLSPLDRGGLFPSHGGILDPLSTSVPRPQRPPPPPSAPAPSSSSAAGAAPSLFHHPFRDAISPAPGSASSLYRPFPDLPVPVTSRHPIAASSTTTSMSLAASVTFSQAVTSPFAGLFKQERHPSGGDSHEEVLVDDFDGQCCRTYPYNHSRIQRWQREKRKRKAAAEAGEAATAAALVKREKGAAAASAAGSESSASGGDRGAGGGSEADKAAVPAKAAKSQEAAGSSIPVGIAIGRQRQLDSEKRSTVEEFYRCGAGLAKPEKFTSTSSGAGASGAGGSEPGSAPASSLVATRGAVGPSVPGSSSSGGAPPSWPPIPSPHHHPLWNPTGTSGHHPPAPYPHPHSHPLTPWLPPGGVSPAGPIPMGYQLAKDPLTGQLLLIPTDSSMPTPPTAAHPPAWPPGPHGLMPPPFGAHAPPLGLPPPPSAATAAAGGGDPQAHYHHMYLQHQQHFQYLQAAAASRDILHASAAAAAAAAAASSSNASAAANPTQRQPPRKEPETITVSDDDDVVQSKSVVETKRRRSSSSPSRATSALAINSLCTPTVAKEKNDKISPTAAVPKKEPQKPEDEDESTPAPLPAPVTQKKASSEIPVKKEPENQVAKPAAKSDNESTIEEPRGEKEKSSSTKVKTEVRPASEQDVSSCVDALMSLSSSTMTTVKTTVTTTVEQHENGLDLLLQGVALKEQEQEEEAANQSSALDLLCSASQRDALSFGLHRKYLNVNLLCSVTEYDYVSHLNYVDPLVLLRQQYNLHGYRSSDREAAVKEFIQAKIRQYAAAKEEAAAAASEDGADGSGGTVVSREDRYLGLKSLEKVIKQIRNTDIMSELEVEIRAMMVKIQALYREKQREIARLKSTPKKKGGKRGSSRLQRGPGRPKKRKLKSLKSKMGRPRKKPPMPTIMSEDEGEEGEAEDGDHKVQESLQKQEEEDLSPPVLEPCGPAAFVSQFGGGSSRRGSADSALKSGTSSSKGNSSASRQTAPGLLKPPKLTASLSPPHISGGGSNGGHTIKKEETAQLGHHSVTELSTIHSKFMKGKANPFANLMKLAVPPSSTQRSAPNSDREDDEEEEDEDEEEVVSKSEKGEEEEEDDDDGTNSDTYASSRGTISSPPPLLKAASSKESSSAIKESDAEDGSGASKRRKSEKPRKHMGSTETIVPKKPRNLFMMSLNMQKRGFKVMDSGAAKNREDQYEFHEDEDEEEEEDIVVEDEEDEDIEVPTTPLPSVEVKSTAAAPSEKSTSLAVGGTVASSAAGGKISPASSASEVRSRRSSTSPRPPPSKKKRRSTSSSSHSGTEVWSTVNPDAKTKTPKEKTKKEARNKNPADEKSKSQSKPAVSSSPSESKSGQTAILPAGEGEYPPDPTLRPTDLGDDLGDGLRVLALTDGRFWPSVVKNTQLDGVFTVACESGRRNELAIMCREDLLRDAVHYVRPEGKAQLTVGTRVCVYWSKEYTCLFPGTVEPIEDEDEEEGQGTTKRKLFPVREDLIEVLLDDGDRRQVDVSKVLMLPQNYPRVVYDPDPISSMRRRRVSNDSVDSGSGDHRLHMQRPPQMAPLTSYVASTSQLTPSPRKQRTPPSAKSSSSAANTSGSATVTSSAEASKKKHKKRHKKHSHSCAKHGAGKKRSSTGKISEEEDQLKIKLDGSFNNTTTYSIRSPGGMQQQQGRSTVSAAAAAKSSEDKDADGDDEDEDTSAESSSEEDEDESHEKTKPGINPVTGRPLWTWLEGDEGYRRPGLKGKMRKRYFHRAIQRGPGGGDKDKKGGDAGSDEVLNVGDCAVFLSTARVDRPYIGRIETMWEGYGGSMMVKVKWFYHPEEIETAGKKFDLKVPGGLFQSPHTDENDVQTISHGCNVLPLKEFSKRRKQQQQQQQQPGDTYYLAGSYDPTMMTVSFQQGVLKQ